MPADSAGLWLQVDACGCKTFLLAAENSNTGILCLKRKKSQDRHVFSLAREKRGCITSKSGFLQEKREIKSVITCLYSPQLHPTCTHLELSLTPSRRFPMPMGVATEDE